VKGSGTRAGALLVVMLCFVMPAGANDAVSDEQFRNYYHLPQAPESLAREILSRDEFKQSFGERLLDQLRTRIVEALEEFFSKLFRHVRLPKGLDLDRDISWSVTVSVLLCVLGTAVVLGLWYAYKKLGWGRGKVGVDAGKQHEEIPGASDSQGLWDRALKTAEQAEYRAALILLFRSLVSRLHEEGLLSFHRGKTNREIVDSIGPVPFRDLLTEMVVRFNRVRYGDAACGRGDYEEFLGLCRRVAEQL
jgi:hypothetical protein